MVFMNECENNACADATDMILSSIGGDSGMFGCDMLNILENGDRNGNWLKCSRDLVATKSAYLYSLVLSGIMAHSTYVTIQSKDKDSWKVVSDNY